MDINTEGASPSYSESYNRAMYVNTEGALLRKCYMRGFVAAELTSSTGRAGIGRTLVTPLVGAGCRGWPVDVAARAAVEAVKQLAHISAVEDGASDNMNPRSGIKHDDDVNLIDDVMLSSDVKKMNIVRLVVID